MPVDDLARLVGWTGHGRVATGQELETAFGLAIPEDFRELVSRFPPGRFATVIQVAHPDYAADFPEDFREMIGEIRRVASPAELPFEFGTVEGQLCPWGWLNLYVLFTWLIDGPDPNGWPCVVITFDDEVRWERYDIRSVDLLVALLTPGSEILRDYFDVSQSGATFDPDERPASQSRPAEGPLGPWPPLEFPVQEPTDRTVQIRELLRISVRPADPVDWPAIEERLGYRLPADYRHLFEVVGPGTFGSIRVLGLGDGHRGLGALQAKVYEFAVERRKLGNSAADFPIHPEPGGVIAFGESLDGWVLAWQINGADPDGWSVVAIDPPWMMARSIDLSLTGFLTAYLTDGNRSYAGMPPAGEVTSFEPFE